MVPLPAALDAHAPLVGWRIDLDIHAAAWSSGIGAQVHGGRWNPKGFHTVYASLDPATCLVETAVHRGFAGLDARAHALTSFEVLDPKAVRVVMPDEVPNPAWLHNGIPSANQQIWGCDLLRQHTFVMFPSTVSKLSWNLVFAPDPAAGKYKQLAQDRLVVDTRFNPAP